MSTQPPNCRVCGHVHRLGAPHIWDDEPVKKVATPINNVATKREKVATITKKPPNVATIRRISIRELNQGISKHFSDLPFEVTRNGKVIARVEKP
jgi:hypothetical protein